jgi:purine-binding chemotaxis protein CheW
MSDITEPQELQVVIFGLGSEEYGMDISSLREIIRMVEITRIPKLPGFIEGVINLRGQTTTVIDLRKRFDMDPALTDSSRIIIVDLKGESIGMIVDSVSEVKSISLDDIDSVPSIKDTRTQEYLKGIIKLGERIIILLDHEKILSELELAQTEKVKEEMDNTNS